VFQIISVTGDQIIFPSTADQQAIRIACERGVPIVSFFYCLRIESIANDDGVVDRTSLWRWENPHKWFSPRILIASGISLAGTSAGIWLKSEIP
jgi:hypothetical protein